VQNGGFVNKIQGVRLSVAKIHRHVFENPGCMASIFSVFLVEKVIILIENFMNMYIATNIGITVIMFIIVYGGYFLTTYILCNRMIQEKNK
jgi:putative ABC transport system permease protein